MDKGDNIQDQTNNHHTDESNNDESEWMDYSDQSVYDDEDTGFVEEEEEDDDDEAANEFGYVQEDNIETDDQPKQNYSLLKEDDVRQRQEEDITSISTVLSITKSAASILLPQFNWSISRLNDEWFANEDEIREKVGLLRKPVVQFNAGDLITCKICFDEFSYGCGSVLSAVCGHPYCRECWTRYISTAINCGSPCLLTRCPEPSCKAAVGPDLIGVVTAKEDHERYKHFLLRSYIEGHRKIKWCPAPNCQYAVQFNADGSGNYDVSCLCSNSFCWNCTVEIHRPVDCATAGKWTAKNKDEHHNAKWILVNTKPCPKCKRPINKDGGCNVMRCSVCRFRFCWLCLCEFKKCHCHSYNRGNFVAEERGKKEAKKYLEKYIYYYERWANNISSKKKAMEDFNRLQSDEISTISEIQCQSGLELKFIIEAWQQIIEGRQILRWSYAYGYYIPEDELLKLKLFEHLLGHAVFSLERLHQCTESDLQEYISAKVPLESFHDFRLKLTGLTNATTNYFDKLVRALESGLSEINPNYGNYWACDRCTYINQGSATTCAVCAGNISEPEFQIC